MYLDIIGKKLIWIINQSNKQIIIKIKCQVNKKKGKYTLVITSYIISLRKRKIIHFWAQITFKGR